MENQSNVCLTIKSNKMKTHKRLMSARHCYQKAVQGLADAKSALHSMVSREFEILDCSNDGRVSASEYLAHALKTYEDITDVEISMLLRQFERADRDLSGKLTFDEVLAMHYDMCGLSLDD